ncbi:hypothetical protein F442_22725 [Phytophthora nicotianae P10297]|uniref:Uncharacterized protein n=1 Tax=Phytophthora nicotianae P10297 TaxID=1317064 RepID=W2Y017_PHYNI|nr:hypothetical protein F442_22725 [Phytophthora nicotianae P10297]
MDLLEDMKLLELATKRLQSEDLTVISARDIFDEVLVDFPQLENRMKGDAKIVESVNFESAIVKIMSGEERTLTSEERVAATRLRRNPEVPQPQSSKKAQRTRNPSQPKTKPNVGRQKRTRTNS